MMVRSSGRVAVTLAVFMTLLALADGILHFSLDYILFRGNVFGRLGPPPGAAPPQGGGGGNLPPSLPLPLNQLFALNLFGYLVLIALLWFVAPRLGSRWWVIDVLFLMYVAATVLGWLHIGAPNPMRLGYLARAIEFVLVVVVLVRLWLGLTRGQKATATTVRETSTV